LEEKTHLGVPFFGCSRLVMPFSGCARLQVPFYRFSRQGCGWSARWRLEEWEIGASKSHAGWLSMRDPQATSCRDGDAVQRRQARRFNLGEQDIPVVWQHDADARCRGHHMRCAVETKVGVDASHLRRDIRQWPGDGGDMLQTIWLEMGAASTGCGMLQTRATMAGLVGGGGGVHG
jgi:hypothetical protein